jgi:hypothetical protein
MDAGRRGRRGALNSTRSAPPDASGLRISRDSPLCSGLRAGRFISLNHQTPRWVVFALVSGCGRVKQRDRVLWSNRTSIESLGRPGENRSGETPGGELPNLDYPWKNRTTLRSHLTVAPASRFSNTAETGIRVPRKTHAPLNLPGTLSTAGHCNQSRVAMFLALSHRAPYATLFVGSGRRRPPPRAKIQTFSATFPGPWGCLLTQDSQRPMLVMGRPFVLTFVQRGFEDSTALR